MAEQTIYLHGEFGVDITSDKVIPLIDKAITDKITILTFDISSIGGSVLTGREIMGAIERAKMAGIEIHTRCLSFAYSMGANLFLMGTKGHRKISEHAELMVHPAMGEAIGNAKEIMQVASSLQEMSDNLLEYITKDNPDNAENIKTAFESKKLIGASEAIALGLADGYVEKLKAVAYYSPKNNNMTNNDEAVKEVKSLKAWFTNFFAKHIPSAKNASKAIGDTIFQYEGEFAVGTKVFTDPEMTMPVPDGVYEDVTVAAGEITAITTPAENKELSEAIAKVAELEAQLAAKDTVIAEKTAEVTDLTTKVGEAVNKITEFENKFIGSGGNPANKKEVGETDPKKIEKSNYINSLKSLKNARN